MLHLASRVVCGLMGYLPRPQRAFSLERVCMAEARVVTVPDILPSVEI